MIIKIPMKPFIVLEEVLRIDSRDGHVTLNSGEMYVAPKGIEYKPFADSEVKMKRLAALQNDVWI